MLIGVNYDFVSIVNEVCEVVDSNKYCRITSTILHECGSYIAIIAQLANYFDNSIKGALYPEMPNSIFFNIKTFL